MSETREERMEQARETIEIARRLLPSNKPDPEIAAEFHELHAAHERALGHEERAREAEQRARRARGRS